MCSYRRRADPFPSIEFPTPYQQQQHRRITPQAMSATEQAAAQAKAAKDDGAPLLDVLEEDDEFEVRWLWCGVGVGLFWVLVVHVKAVRACWGSCDASPFRV